MTNLKFPVIEAVCRIKGGELWNQDLMDLVRMVVDKLKADAGFNWQQISAVYVANCFAQATHQIGMLDSQLADAFELPIPVAWWAGTDLAGSKALERACLDVMRGTRECILVIGVEQLSTLLEPEQQRLLASWLLPVEQQAGLGLTGAYALMAQQYLAKFQLDAAQLATVSVLHHRHALDNPLAQLRRELKVEPVQQSAMVSSPLRQLHLAPFGDGAAAVVVRKGADTDLVGIQSAGFGYEPMALAARELTELGAVRSAAHKALGAGHVSLEQLNTVVVADKFTIDTVLSLEALGLSRQGEALQDIERGVFSLDRNCSLNPRGGLKTSGFAPGASSLSQIVEAVEFLIERKAGHALVSSVGGSGYESSAFVLSLGEHT